MDVKPLPLAFAALGLILILFSFFSPDPNDSLLRIVIGPSALRFAGVLLLASSLFRILSAAGKRRADSATARELAACLELCARMGADECLVGTEDGACLILAGFGEDDPQVLRTFPEQDAPAFIQAFRDYLSDAEDEAWIVSPDFLPEDVEAAAGVIRPAGEEGGELLVIVLHYKENEENFPERDKILEISE